MESTAKAAIIAALITAIGAIIVALITNWNALTPSKPNTPLQALTPIACPTIPPVTDSKPSVRDGFVWIPGYWNWAYDKFVWKSGHWERPKAGSSNRVSSTPIPGYWDTSSGSCVWIPRRVEGETTVKMTVTKRQTPVIVLIPTKTD